MKPLSIRVRLTAWYFGVLVVIVAVFGTVALVAMQSGIRTSVDEGLRRKENAIEELIARASPEGPERLRYELREHSELSADGNFSQVRDQDGNWTYRSRLMARYDLPLPANDITSIYNLQPNGLPLRVLVHRVTVDGQTYRIQVAAPMDDFYGAIDHFKWVLLLLSPFLVGLASIGGYWMSRRALTPVDHIIREAQNINSQNLSKRLDVLKSGDELERLSETLNSMLERLDASFNRITQFTADASHELRTPIALMRTMTEVSLRTCTTGTEYREVQVQILEELEKTSELLEKLMLLARADAGAETLGRAPLDLATTLRGVCRQGRTLAGAKQIKMEEKLPSIPVMIEGDRDALYRLFLILIDNAVKYTGCGGLIAVSLATNDGIATVEIQDTGIGIASEDLPRIFDRFYRADKARSRELGGVGLGLSIARWEVEAHGGSIDVWSTVGKGSTFRVGFPLLKDAPAN